MDTADVNDNDEEEEPMSIVPIAPARGCSESFFCCFKAFEAVDEDIVSCCCCFSKAFLLAAVAKKPSNSIHSRLESSNCTRISPPWDPRLPAFGALWVAARKSITRPAAVTIDDDDFEEDEDEDEVWLVTADDEDEEALAVEPFSLVQDILI